MMDNEKVMETRISPEIQHAIADLLELCKNNNTDSVTMELDYPRAILEVEINFRITPKKEPGR